MESRDETGGSGFDIDAFMLRLYEKAGQLTSHLANDLIVELKKRPALKRLAIEIDELSGMHATRPWVLDRIAEGIPEEKVLERIFGEFRHEESSSVLVAEIVLERGRIDAMWDRMRGLEAEEGDTKQQQKVLLDDIQSAKIALHHRVFLYIAEGRVEAVDAAAAVLGHQSLSTSEEFTERGGRS